MKESNSFREKERKDRKIVMTCVVLRFPHGC